VQFLPKEGLEVKSVKLFVIPTEGLDEVEAAAEGPWRNAGTIYQQLNQHELF
jgi:hypothetical protein